MGVIEGNRRRRQKIYVDHHHWAAVVSRGWAKASACRLQVACIVLSSQSARWCRSGICQCRFSAALIDGVKEVVLVRTE